MNDDPVRAAHQRAVAAGEPGYLDPETGFFVFTAVSLAERGECCRSGCRHCPYPGSVETRAEGRAGTVRETVVGPIGTVGADEQQGGPMSIAVELEELRNQTEAFTADAFLVTVSDDGRPHTVAVRPEWRGDELAVSAGRTTASNAAARPLVSLLWPPNAVGEYSLIVDANATPGADGEVVLRPTRAVLHRPAASGTGSDCKTVI